MEIPNTAEVTDPAPAAAAPAAPTVTQPETPAPNAAPDSDPMSAALAQLERQAADQKSATENPSPAATETQTPETETVKPEGEKPPEDPKHDRVLPNRVSTAQFSDTEQQAIALGKALKDAGEPVPSLKERIEIVEARQKGKPEAAPAPAATEPEPQHDTALTELEAKLAEATAKKKELARSLGTEELDDIADEIESLRQQKSAIESQKAEASAARRDAFAAERTKSIQIAKGQFPSSADQNSELAQAIAARITEIKSDPARVALLQDPKAPEIIAAESAMQLAKLHAADRGTSIAAELAILMEPDAPARAAAPATPSAPVARKPTTAGGAASIPPATPPTPRPITLAQAAELSFEELEKVLPAPKSRGFVLRTS